MGTGTPRELARLEESLKMDVMDTAETLKVLRAQERMDSELVAMGEADLSFYAHLTGLFERTRGLPDEERRAAILAGLNARRSEIEEKISAAGEGAGAVKVLRHELSRVAAWSRRIQS